MAETADSNANVEAMEDPESARAEEATVNVTSSDDSAVNTEGSATAEALIAPINDLAIAEMSLAEEETKEEAKEQVLEALLTVSEEPSSVRPSAPLVDTQMDDDDDDVAAKAAVTLAGELSFLGL